MQDSREMEPCNSESNFEDLLRENVTIAGINTRATSDNESSSSGVESPESSQEAIMEDNLEQNQTQTNNALKANGRRHSCNEQSEMTLSSNTVSQRPCEVVIGAILRIMGDEQYCRTCGRHLRFMGDEIYCMYAARNLISPLLQELSVGQALHYQ